MRDLTLNKCIDVCPSQELAEMQTKSITDPVEGEEVGGGPAHRRYTLKEDYLQVLRICTSTGEDEVSGVGKDVYTV